MFQHLQQPCRNRLADPTPSRRRRRRGRAAVLATALASAVLFPAGAALADTGFNMYDVDADGVLDPYVVDSSGNGFADANLVDLNRDGRGDAWLVDRNEDWVIDQIWVDTNADGIVDTWYLDNNEDGVIEATLYDRNHNGLPDGPPPAGGDPNTSNLNWTNLCTSDPFWCGVWPKVANPGAVLVTFSPYLGGPSLAGADDGVPLGVVP